MGRRVVAKKVLRPTVRTWVKEYRGDDIVNAYRKHYYASWSCAVLELNMLGVKFSHEEIDKAMLGQVASLQSIETRKAKKARKAQEKLASEYWWIHTYEDMEIHRLMCEQESSEWTPPQTRDRFVAHCEIGDLKVMWRPIDDYDPFAE